MPATIQRSLFEGDSGISGLPTSVNLWGESVIDWEGEERLDYFVALCDDDGDPVGKVYHFTLGNRAARAYALAEKMAAGHGLELVVDIPVEGKSAAIRGS